MMVAASFITFQQMAKCIEWMLPACTRRSIPAARLAFIWLLVLHWIT